MIVHVVGAAIFHERRLFVAQRSASGPLAGKWEFPGGKIEPSETPQQALVREIDEELGCRIRVAQELAVGTAKSGEKTIELRVFAAFLEGSPDEIELREHQRAQWITTEQLLNFDWAEADIPCLAAVAGAWEKLAVGESRH